MDIDSYEQFTISQSLIGNLAKFLKEGMELTLFVIEDKPLYIEIPKIVEYKVTQTGGSVRGNTVGASFKDAVLENGLTVKVPLFIKNGEIIRVDTRSGEYVERAK
jgi:elongation factor P